MNFNEKTNVQNLDFTQNALQRNWQKILLLAVTTGGVVMMADYKFAVAEDLEILGIVIFTEIAAGVSVFAQALLRKADEKAAKLAFKFSIGARIAMAIIGIALFLESSNFEFADNPIGFIFAPGRVSWTGFLTYELSNGLMLLIEWMFAKLIQHDNTAERETAKKRDAAIELLKQKNGDLAQFQDAISRVLERGWNTFSNTAETSRMKSKPMEIQLGYILNLHSSELDKTRKEVAMQRSAADKNKNAADGARSDAVKNKKRADEMENALGELEKRADLHRSALERARSDAEMSRSALERARNDAEENKKRAEELKNAADGARSDAEEIKNAAEVSRTALESARNYADDLRKVVDLFPLHEVLLNNALDGKTKKAADIINDNPDLLELMPETANQIRRISELGTFKKVAKGAMGKVFTIRKNVQAFYCVSCYEKTEIGRGKPKVCKNCGTQQPEVK